MSTDADAEKPKSAAPLEGTPCWLEIPARDVDKLKEFYVGVFPMWQFKPTTLESKTKVAQYHFKNPEGLSGGIVQMPDVCGPNTQKMGSGFTVYYTVDSIDNIIPTVEKLGGKVCFPKMSQGEGGWFANVADPEGNRFGLYEPRTA